ncbi:hypothetical protein LC612_23235 [Nostoc sp. CHAB 5834]|nr:hypothetical protein [Nostoc sp. CHAB 5834]
MSAISRRALLGASAALLSPSLFAEEQRGVDVVKIMSFACAFCLQAEAHDRRIELEVKAGRGTFVWAPLPSHPEDTGDKERVYYAARDHDARMGAEVKASFYKGMQERGINLFSFAEAHAWLSQDLPQYEAALATVFTKAQSVEGEKPLTRAYKLAASASVSQVPAYILLKNGVIDSALDTSYGEAKTIPALRDAVLERINKLNSGKP